MSESSFWNLLRTKIGMVGHFERVENAVGDGTPDVSYCISGVEGWIELKSRTKAPARTTTSVFIEKGLRDSQVGWAKTRLRHGGNIWILARVGRMSYLVHGEHCEVFNTWTLAELTRNAHWSGAGNWVGLVAMLRTRSVTT